MKTNYLPLILLPLALICPTLCAEFAVHPLFSDHAVLQRDKAVGIWGAADPGAQVTVRFAGKDVAVKAGRDGRWAAQLAPMPASSEPRSLLIASNGKTIELKDVLVGEVWVLGGQSNMEHAVERVSDADLEKASAKYPQIRLLTVPKGLGAQPTQTFKPLNELDTFLNEYEQKGTWLACTPETVAKFSAIGYAFGKRIHLISGVPVGLVDASRGGTTVETWVSRKSLEAIPAAQPMLKSWDDQAAAWNPAADLANRVKAWETKSEELKKQGKPAPLKPEPAAGPAGNMNLPSNCYNGMLSPLEGLTVRGAIFNQGYSNAMSDNSHPALYALMIQSMIRDWRRAFRDETMPFGIIGLTSGGEPQTIENFEVSMLDAAVYIREAQHQAAKEMKGVAYLPSWDQQMNWYHPVDKFPLGERAARWALAETMKPATRLAWKPAEAVEIKFDPASVVVTFDQTVCSRDSRPMSGFAIAGEDQQFFPAEATWATTGKTGRGAPEYDKKKLIVSSPFVPQPVALRFAWARNPLANLTHEGDLRNVPVAEFRTDNWPYPESPFDEKQSGKYRQELNELRKAANAQAGKRLKLEAKRLLNEP